ncbi:MAG: ATP-binding cassette domain-containing protein [Verrucomicrobiota bacterium]
MFSDTKPWLRYHATCGGQHSIDGPAVSLENVTLGYPGNQEPILQSLNLTLGRGRCVSLVGDNGAGKSTLLKSLAGLLSKRAGEMKILGHAVGKCHHQVSYLPQHREIDWSFPINVRRFVATGAYIHLGWFRRSGKTELERAEAILDNLQLLDLGKKRLNELSGGQQQRVLLARTLLHGAELLLLDEPLNAVDAENRARLIEALHALKAEGKTMLIATHDLDFGAGFFDASYRVGEGTAKEEPA